MAKTELKLNVGWVRMAKVLSPAARTTVKLAGNEALGQVAFLAEKLVRQELTNARTEKNADLTIALKGSTKPLVDKGRLFQAITSKRVAPGVFFVGVLKRRVVEGKSEGTSLDIVNIAEAIHDGISIPVTNRMRGLFRALWWATRRHYLRGERMAISKLKSKRAQYLARRAYRLGNEIFPLKPGTTSIRIPSRPFVRNVFESAAAKAQMRAMFSRKMRAALQRLWSGRGIGSMPLGIEVS